MQKDESDINDDGTKVSADGKVLPPHQNSLMHNDNIVITLFYQIPLIY